MPPSRFFIERTMRLYENNDFHTISDPLVLEVPMKIVVNGRNLATLACSPEAFEELAVGFLISEGLLSGTDKVNKITVDQNTVYIELDCLPEAQTKEEGRFINTCSGRGLQSDPISQPIPMCDNGYRFSAQNLLHLITSLDETSFTFQRTGGVHSAALGWGSELLIRYEDIGRHNAVDKVFGRAYLNHVPLYDKCLLLSGRIAAEIVSKALRHGVSLVVSRSAPTLRAVELAEASGMTIVGFARGKRFNTYCHWERIIL
ncbi:MAG TPA: formate dehydrogenase accessory sulfurtransferase FdhD [Syntrophomonadaceae bacterium]|nr:formate dehydrogenase accessory sulfurtransferase FdhD [Syntrophomonadaceae bacterium]